MVVLPWSQVKSDYDQTQIQKFTKNLGEICLLSAEKKAFIDKDEKTAFCYRWLDQYLEQFPDFAYIALDINPTNQETICLGYIVACPDTDKYLDQLDQQGLKWWPKVFPHGYVDFPVHLHINCHPLCRGKGVGAMLVKALESACQKLGLKGIHLITVKGARNVRFYEKVGYIEKADYKLNQETQLVFLGKILSDS